MTRTQIIFLRSVDFASGAYEIWNQRHDTVIVAAPAAPGPDSFIFEFNEILLTDKVYRL